MKNIFVKKYWAEEDVLFFVHFQDGTAIRQLEITPKGKVFLTVTNPRQGESMLFDQPLDERDLEPVDFITEEEFDKVWNDQ